MSDSPTCYNGFSPEEIRALYQLILERMEIDTPSNRRRWEWKVRRWKESVRRKPLHVSLRELVER